ncbi:hypothetical protein ACPFP2_04440 [Micromonospora citrea]|uniref:hypothetical protein n=1 Tax=Micromonospora citrea TaxID=47855 RepID=UPI003C521CBA
MSRTRRGLGLAAVLAVAAGGVWAVVPSASAADAPRITAVTGVAEGATLSGTARIEAQTSGQVDRVEFALAGPSAVRWTERQTPYHFMGNTGATVTGWNAAEAKEGAYTLAVRAVGQAGAAERTVKFTVRHTATEPDDDQPTPPAPNPPAPSPSASAPAPGSNAANPSVSNGVATFTASRTIDKFTVPNSWSQIVIDAGVTLKGNFVIPENRTAALTIAGKNAETSVVTGNGPHTKDFTQAGVSTEASIKLTLRNYTSLNPRFYHMHAKKSQLLVSGMRYIDDRDEYHNNSDGFSGGANSVIENTFIDTWDDSVKLYNGDLTIRNTTILHNGNGAPIQMAWGDYGHGTATIDGLTVISNSTKHYNQGVFSWAGGTKADSRTIKIVGNGLTRKVNPGMKEGPLYVFKDGVKNKTTRIEGGVCSVLRSTAANTVQGTNTSGNQVVVTGCR